MKKVLIICALTLAVIPFLLSPDSFWVRSVRKLEVVPLTTDQIFSSSHTLVTKYPKEDLRTVVATGDVMLGRSVNTQTIKRADFTWAFGKTGEFLKEADIALVNLEGPLVENCPLTDTGMIFCGDTRHVEGLAFAGMDVVNLANNHAANYGERGIYDTKLMLEERGIGITGLTGRNLVVREVRGLKFGFLGFNDIEKNRLVMSAEESEIKQQIVDARRQVDILVVSFHWGDEYKDRPNARQIDLGRLAVETGADLVIGHHPHWIQGVEVYMDKVIAYSHGNFIFDQEWSRETKEGVVGKYIFYKNKLLDVEFFPVLIQNYGQPAFLDEEGKMKILEKMEKLSR